MTLYRNFSNLDIVINVNKTEFFEITPNELGKFKQLKLDPGVVSYQAFGHINKEEIIFV